MQVNSLSQTNFTGALNNKYLLKGLEKVSDHGMSVGAGTSLIMSLAVRPLAIYATPDVEKENKQYDFTSLNKFFNEMETPKQLVEELTQLAFNYAMLVDEDNVESFKDDISTIYVLRDALMDID